MRVHVYTDPHGWTIDAYVVERRHPVATAQRSTRRAAFVVAHRWLRGGEMALREPGDDFWFEGAATMSPWRRGRRWVTTRRSNSGRSSRRP